MKFGINRHLLRKTVLWIAPMALLSGTIGYAHDRYYGDGYYDDHARRHHQRDERRAQKEHEREERYRYGNSWELRQHQKEERHQLKHHQRDERRDGYYNSDGYDNRY